LLIAYKRFKSDHFHNMNKKILLQGILFDEKSSFMQGPAQAPPLIRKYFHSPSSNYFSETGKEITEETYEDLGDFKISRYQQIEKITSDNLQKGNHLLTLGGDHSITYPVLKALKEKHEEFQILHIDAHADLYDEFEGDPYSHACPFARIMNDRLASHLIQVGIRTLSRHQKKQAEKYKVALQEMKDFDASKLIFKDMPVYISLDMDAFDPGFAPGVSHHEPGGLSPRQVINLLHQIKNPVIGADIVEYNPKRDFNYITAALAAKMMKEIIALMA
jgi:arginase